MNSTPAGRTSASPDPALISPEVTFITGQTVVVYGGFIA
jgi:hypothetical protein